MDRKGSGIGPLDEVWTGWVLVMDRVGTGNGPGGYGYWTGWVLVMALKMKYGPGGYW